MHHMRQEKGKQAEHPHSAQEELLPDWHNRRILALYRISTAVSADGRPRDQPKCLPACPDCNCCHDGAVCFHVLCMAEKGSKGVLVHRLCDQLCKLCS